MCNLGYSVATMVGPMVTHTLLEGYGLEVSRPSRVLHLKIAAVSVLNYLISLISFFIDYEMICRFVS